MFTRKERHPFVAFSSLVFPLSRKRGSSPRVVVDSHDVMRCVRALANVLARARVTRLYLSSRQSRPLIIASTIAPLHFRIQLLSHILRVSSFFSATLYVSILVYVYIHVYMQTCFFLFSRYFYSILFRSLTKMSNY